MQSVFGVDIPQGVQWLLALALVLGLVVIFGWILRRFAGGKLRAKGQNTRGRQPRLGVVDIYDLDRQRQLILLRRDNVEHLVMVGGPNDVVVESTIIRSMGRSVQPTATAEIPESTLEPVLATPAPAAQPVAAQTVVAREPSSRESVKDPVKDAASDPVLPSLRSAATAVAAVATEAVVATKTSFAGAVNAPTPAAVTAPSVPAPALQAPVIPDVPKPEPARIEMPDIKTAAQDLVAMPLPQPAAPAANVAATAKASATELDDMTRQLESALKRPFAAAPPTIPAARPETAPRSEMSDAAAKQAEKALADALDLDFGAPVIPAKTEAKAEPKALPKTETAKSEVPKSEAPKTEAPKIEPAPKPSAQIVSEAVAAPMPAQVSPPAQVPPPAPVVERVLPPQPKPAAEPAAPKAAPVVDAKPAAAAKPDPVAAPAKPSPDAKASPDPFSSEAIEAEFARLLGRSPDGKT